MWPIVTASWLMGAFNWAYESVHPSIVKLAGDSEMWLPLATLVLVVSSAGAGWTAKSIAAGHREKLRKKLFDGEGVTMPKVARRRRQEDAVYEVITGLVYKKVMSSKEAKRIFRVLSDKAGMEGLCIPDKEYKKLHAYQMSQLKAKTEAGIEALKNAPPLPLPKEEPKKIISLVRSAVARVTTHKAA